MFDFNPLAALFLFRALSIRDAKPYRARTNRLWLKSMPINLLTKLRRPKRSETPAERMNWSLSWPRIAEKRN